MTKILKLGIAATALLGAAAAATYVHLSPTRELERAAEQDKPAPTVPQHPAMTSVEKIKRLASMSTAEMTGDPDVRPVLMALTGAHWPQFERAMTHGVARESEGLVFAYACTDNPCTGDEAALAVETASGRVYAMLFRRGGSGDGKAEMRWFGPTSLDELPLPLLHFAALNGLDVPPALVEKAVAFTKRAALGR